LREAGISPKRSKAHRQLFRKMTLTNCLIGELRASREENRALKNRENIKSIASGRRMKKYRCMNIFNKETGICRKGLSTETAKVLTHMKTKIGDLSSEEIEYEEWQRVDVDGKKE
ncbi:hypothetical protein MAR_011038, partial [Mya arenaria]